jgi:hypothetical protein
VVNGWIAGYPPGQLYLATSKAYTSAAYGPADLMRPPKGCLKVGAGITFSGVLMPSNPCVNITEAFDFGASIDFSQSIPFTIWTSSNWFCTVPLVL